MNDIEVVWHDLKAYQLAHKTFTDVVELNDAIHTAVSDLNRERMTVPLANPRVSPLRLSARGYRKLIRYPLAVVAGSFLGEAFSIPVAVEIIDAAFGHEATGGRWPFTAANVIIPVCIKGLMTGYAAGWFSGKRGNLSVHLPPSSLCFSISHLGLWLTEIIQRIWTLITTQSRPYGTGLPSSPQL